MDFLFTEESFRVKTQGKIGFKSKIVKLWDTNEIKILSQIFSPLEALVAGQGGTSAHQFVALNDLCCEREARRECEIFFFTRGLVTYDVAENLNQFTVDNSDDGLQLKRLLYLNT